MSGNKLGGQRCAATNKARYGANYYVKLGHLGGSAPTRYPKGFAANRDAARRGGVLGGRGKNKLTDRERREIRKAYEELLAVHVAAKRVDHGAITVYDRKRGLVSEQVA